MRQMIRQTHKMQTELTNSASQWSQISYPEKQSSSQFNTRNPTTSKKNNQNSNNQKSFSVPKSNSKSNQKRKSNPQNNLSTPNHYSFVVEKSRNQNAKQKILSEYNSSNNNCQNEDTQSEQLQFLKIKLPPKYKDNDQKSLRKKSEKCKPSYQEILQEKRSLQHNMQHLIKVKKFRKVIDVEERLRKVASKQYEVAMKLLRDQQQQELQSIKNTYKQELQRFYSVWNDIFYKYRAKKQSAIIEFQRSQSKQLQCAKVALHNKIKHIKVNKKPLIDLDIQQMKFLKEKRFQDLIGIQNNKKRIKQKLLQQRNIQIKKITGQQEKKLQQNYCKNYYSLVMRIEDFKFHHEKIFTESKEILKKKYLNVINKLDHQHSLEKQQAQKKMNRSCFL